MLIKKVMSVGEKYPGIGYNRLQRRSRWNTMERLAVPDGVNHQDTWEEQSNKDSSRSL